MPGRPTGPRLWSAAVGTFGCTAGVVLCGAGCDTVEVRLGGAGPSVDAPMLEVQGDLDLSEHLSELRSCADGGDLVAYAVTETSGDRVSLAPAPAKGCLSAGDEVLVLVMQAAAADASSVGEHALLRVREVVGDQVAFVAPPTFDWSALVTDESTRIVLQRVPGYQRLTVAVGATLTAPAWNGTTGGVLALRVSGDVVIDGTVDLSGKGYRGGAERLEVLQSGLQGESIAGPGIESQLANFGGGGGGLGDQTTDGCVQDGNAGGGGGQAEAGQPSSALDLCDGAGRGEGGLAVAATGRLLLGSGGGSGGVDNVRVDNPPGAAGGAGGGIVWILGQSISGGGAILARGDDGFGDEPGLECEAGFSTETCFDHSGPGGGGAGGTVLLEAALVDVATVSVAGGAGGNGFDTAGGNGGDGAPGVVEL